MKNIVFDYDGTLHNCIKIYSPAFRLAYDHLISLGYAEKKEIHDKEISKWLGFNSKDMWDLFMPNLPSEVKDECSEIIGKAMIKYLHEGKAELYPHSLDVLKILKGSGYNLIFLSNCKKIYMDTHKRIFNLDDYFVDFYCAEEYGFKPKYEIFNFIKKKYNGEFAIIGDKYQDVQIAIKHNLYSIGCMYGYGSKDELKRASITVNNITEVLNYLN